MIRFGDFVRRAERQGSEEIGLDDADFQTVQSYHNQRYNNNNNNNNHFSSLADAADRFLVSTTSNGEGGESSYGDGERRNDRAESEAILEEDFEMNDDDLAPNNSSEYQDATALEIGPESVVQSENEEEEAMEIEETRLDDDNAAVEDDGQQSESSSLNESLAEQSRRLTQMLNEDTEATFNVPQSGRNSRNQTNHAHSEISVSHMTHINNKFENIEDNEGEEKNGKSELMSMFEKCLAQKSEIGGQMFVCSECQYETARASRLKEHLAVHCKEKSYKCSECSYASRWNKDLKRHMRNRHNKES